MNAERFAAIVDGFPRARICVVGDLFLDKYLDLDGGLTETSLETGLDAYQVGRVRCYPGAGGTVANNLAALGVGQVSVLSLIGDDGEGYDLRQALRRAAIDDSWLKVVAGFQTPTYTKPMLQQGGTARELNRLDFKNRRALDAAAEDWLLQRLEAAAGAFSALVIADQVQERNCGVISDRVRARLAELAQTHPQVVFLADSRCRIAEFRNVITKPNRAEAVPGLAAAAADIDSVALQLAQRTQRPVYVTLGAEGLLVAEGGQAPLGSAGQVTRVPTYRVAGEIDIVGAGDSTMAGIAAALCSGASLAEAGLAGCLTASITIQQIGVTGTATPAQLRQRFAEYVQQRG